MIYSHHLLSLWERHAKVAASLPSFSGEIAEAPLVRWVRPGDRGLPLSLVRRPLGELVKMSFEQLSEVPGVGPRKLAMLLTLFERVRDALSENSVPQDDMTRVFADHRTDFTPAFAKYEQWSKDVHAIRTAGWDEVPLGRAAPSLASLPRSLWAAPLGQFTRLKYEELFSIPYFGPRRIDSVVGIVCDVAHVARSTSVRSSPDELIFSPSVKHADLSIRTWLADGDQLRYAAVVRELVGPVMDQLVVDNGKRAVAVARRMFGVFQEDGSGSTTDDGGGDAELSRPRISQIKNNVYEIFSIRWPQRKEVLDALIRKCVDRKDDAGITSLVLSVRELLVGKAASTATVSGHWLQRSSM